VHRTTIMLPPELKRRAADLASSRGISLGELIREALEEQLGRHRINWSEDPLFKDHVIWDGDGPTDLAANHDHYLYDLDEP
jgi:hypothetical protein